ncbi:MAG: DUF3365 domain-containing protein, partial [Methylococcales bacterium]
KDWTFFLKSFLVASWKSFFRGAFSKTLFSLNLRFPLYYFKKLSELLDNKTFDFMGALIVEAACLQCHESQGYRLGDVRGGIRVSIPTDLFQQEIQLLQQYTVRNQIFVVLGAMIVSSIFYIFSVEFIAIRKILSN